MTTWDEIRNRSEQSSLFDSDDLDPRKPWQRSVALEGPGQARDSDPETAHEAARLIRAKATSARVLLLAAFQTAGESGYTDEQAAEAAGLPMTSEYATRCSELDRIGVLTTTTERRASTRTGLDRVVRTITPLGLWVMRSR